ncbi:hypothetical protein MASR2M29_22240 [Spirochaetota bacterium]
MYFVALASESEKECLKKLEETGIKAVAPSNLLVPVSDFSKIIKIPIEDALLRIGHDDPRHTALLDELALRMYAPSPEKRDWSILYFYQKKDMEAAVVQLKKIAVPFFGQSIQKDNSKAWNCLYALIWAILLMLPVFKKTQNANSCLKSGKPFKTIQLAGFLSLYNCKKLLFLILKYFSALPLLFLDTVYGPLGLMLYLTVLNSIFKLKDYKTPKNRALLFLGLPFLALLAFLVFSIAKNYMNSLFWLLSGTIVFSLYIIKRKLEKPDNSKKLNSYIPIMVNKKLIASYRNMVLLFIPVLVLFASSTFAFKPYLLKHSNNGTSGTLAAAAAIEAVSMLNSHIEYQYALTYGRLGEAGFGKTGYKEPFTYSQKEGRLYLSPKAEQKPPKEAFEAYDDLLFILDLKSLPVLD